MSSKDKKRAVTIIDHCFKTDMSKLKELALLNITGEEYAELSLYLRNKIDDLINEHDRAHNHLEEAVVWRVFEE